MKTIPAIPTDMKCPWCKKVGITPIGEPEWCDNKGEGGSGIGFWIQVFTHPPCVSNTFTRWSYIIGREGDKVEN